jgi:hypothetical protein
MKYVYYQRHIKQLYISNIMTYSPSLMEEKQTCLCKPGTKPLYNPRKPSSLAITPNAWQSMKYVYYQRHIKQLYISNIMKAIAITVFQLAVSNNTKTICSYFSSILAAGCR